MASIYDLLYNVGGGMDQATLNLQAQQQAADMENVRHQTGFQLLDYLTGLQQNPFSIVPALQAYGAGGGGPMASANAFAQTGGIGNPSPYGAIAQQLIQGLSEFTGGTPINPNTGRPFTPTEMAYLRVFAENQKKKTTTPTKEKKTGPVGNGGATQTTAPARTSASATPEGALTDSLVDQIRQIRSGSAKKRAGKYTEPILGLLGVQ